MSSQENVIHSQSGLQPLLERNGISETEFQNGIHDVITSALININVVREYRGLPLLQSQHICVIWHGSRVQDKESLHTQHTDADLLVVGNISSGYGIRIFELDSWTPSIPKCHIAITDTGDLRMRLKDPATDDDFFLVNAIQSGTVVHGTLPERIADISIPEIPKYTKRDDSLRDMIGD